MYRIKRTVYILRNGDREYSNEQVDVKDLEEYRRSIRQARHARINFIYQTISDNESDREDKEA